MKVAVLNNDFRVYWKGRLIFLRDSLALKNTELFAVELFGKGSPYDFDDYHSAEKWWTCLFPDKRAADLQAAEIKQALFAALDKINADVIIAPSIVFFAGAIGMQWAKKNQRKFIMFDDARPAQVKRNMIVQWIKDRIIAQADALWLPSAHYDGEYPQFLKKGILFFYGFSSINNKLFGAAHSYNATSNKIICIARLVPIKNIDNLLRAWQMVEAQNNATELIIVGDGPELAALKQLQTGLNLKRVVFAGSIDNTALPAYYASSGAFILPSLSETWGLVVNEAMAAGLPVLLSRKVNAAQSLLNEGVNGFGFDPDDINGIANAISRFLDLGEVERTAMSEASLRLVDTMNYQAMGEQLWDALITLQNRKFKKPDILSAAIINAWNGRYNTSGWDKL